MNPNCHSHVARMPFTNPASEALKFNTAHSKAKWNSAITLIFSFLALVITINLRTTILPKVFKILGHLLVPIMFLKMQQF